MKIACAFSPDPVNTLALVIGNLFEKELNIFGLLFYKNGNMKTLETSNDVEFFYSLPNNLSFIFITDSQENIYRKKYKDKEYIFLSSHITFHEEEQLRKKFNLPALPYNFDNDSRAMFPAALHCITNKIPEEIPKASWIMLEIVKNKLKNLFFMDCSAPSLPFNLRIYKDGDFIIAPLKNDSHITNTVHTWEFGDPKVYLGNEMPISQPPLLGKPKSGNLLNYIEEKEKLFESLTLQSKYKKIKHLHQSLIQKRKIWLTQMTYPIENRFNELEEKIENILTFKK